jgi:acetyl esterase/lipase
MGVSAGAHLSLLYAYRNDTVNRDVRAVVNIVGPIKFTGAAVNINPVYQGLILGFTGKICALDADCKESSPITFVSPDDPPTISFYGNSDPLIYNSQGPALVEKLDEAGVPNEQYRYPGGHFTWAEKYKTDMKTKIVAFLHKYL